MNIEQSPSCRGIFGKLFGHNFRSIFAETKIPIQNANISPATTLLQNKEALLKVVEQLTSISLAQIETDSVVNNSEISNASNIIDKLYDESNHKNFAYFTEETYNGDVCRRCGLIVNQPYQTTNKQQTQFILDKKEQ